MDVPLTVLRRTWLVTTIFLVATTPIWWMEAGWSYARISTVSTIVLCPPVWWWIVGRGKHPGFVRGLVAGALIGPLTQALPYAAPKIWYSVARPGQVEGDLAAGINNAFLIVVGILSAVMCAPLGLIAVLIQRRADRPTSSAAPSDTAGGAGQRRQSTVAPL